MAVLPTGIGPVTGYNIERSLRFNSADTAYLNRTPASAGNRKTWTWSGWVKRSALGSAEYLFAAGTGGTDTTQQGLNFQADNTLRWTGSATVYLVTTQVFRDPSAWYHVVFVFDTTQATANNRQKIYINGTQITAFTTQTNPTQNLDYAVNQAAAFNIGRWTGASNYFNGYMTEINFIDGQALTPSDFGETDTNTGVWKPKAYSGSYGTNGFYLKFADNSGTTSTTLGKDSSGNGNNWTPNGFSVTAGAGNDSLVDSPTNYGSDTGAGGEVRGNYCTLNPLYPSGGTRTFANGNLEVTGGALNANSTELANWQLTTGKWYFEGTVGAIGLASITQIGTSVATYYGNGTFFPSGSGASYTTNDVIGVAADIDAGTVQFYKNGVSQGTVTGTAGTASFPAFALGGNATPPKWIVNFGQRPFEKWNGSAYVANTAPSGFKALCTQNLPTPTIGATSTTQANKYMDVTLYTGNQTVRSITNSGSMQPDFVWDKLRSGSNSHRLFDAVRGVEKALYSNLTNIETTETGTLTSFNSNGFSLGTSTETNTTGSTYVAWQWNAGGSNQTISVGQYSTSPNVPSIASTVRANTTSGFSIVTFTTNNTAGATVGHGLGAVPDMIIMKYRGLAANWVVYHKSMNATPQNGYLNLNTTAGYAALIDPWNNTAPSSTVITMGAGAGSAGSTNYSVYTSVAYCFAAVPGYSAFGSYTGNGSTDGPFVYTGFRPRYVLIKRTDTTNNWFVSDSSIAPYNLVENGLYPNLSNAEGAINALDFLSNGFKPRANYAGANASGGTYIYAAFAESPFKYSLAR